MQITRIVCAIFIPTSHSVLLIKMHSSLNKSGAGHNMYVINNWSILAVGYNFMFSMILLKPSGVARPTNLVGHKYGKRSLATLNLTTPLINARSLA